MLKMLTPMTLATLLVCGLNAPGAMAKPDSEATGTANIQLASNRPGQVALPSRTVKWKICKFELRLVPIGGGRYEATRVRVCRYIYKRPFGGRR